MNVPSAPRVDCWQQHACLMVADLEAAVVFCTTRLGFTRSFTWGTPPTFGGVMLDRGRQAGVRDASLSSSAAFTAGHSPARML